MRKNHQNGFFQCRMDLVAVASVCLCVPLLALWDTAGNTAYSSHDRKAHCSSLSLFLSGLENSNLGHTSSSQSDPPWLTLSCFPCRIRHPRAEADRIELPKTDKVMSSGDSNPAATPTPCVDIQGDGRWMSLHNHFVSNSKDKEPDVLFVGDSLVQLLHQFEVWRELFSPLHALNFGVGGDETQHVLWRLSNGELAHISPKVVVLWVGTHNHGHTAEQICGGIMAIVQLIKDKLPKAYTLVLGVLPRGKMPNPLRERNAQVNKLVKDAVSSLPHASLLNVDPGFVHSDGSISHQDLYDFLHLTPQGYQAVCQPLHVHLKGLLEKQAEN